MTIDREAIAVVRLDTDSANLIATRAEIADQLQVPLGLLPLAEDPELVHEERRLGIEPRRLSEHPRGHVRPHPLTIERAVEDLVVDVPGLFCHARPRRVSERFAEHSFGSTGRLMQELFDLVRFALLALSPDAPMASSPRSRAAENHSRAARLSRRCQAGDYPCRRFGRGAFGGRGETKRRSMPRPSVPRA